MASKMIKVDFIHVLFCVILFSYFSSFYSVEMSNAKVNEEGKNNIARKMEMKMAKL